MMILSSLSAAFAAFFLIAPDPAFATQMHTHSEGILVHQVGHIFFLISMVILYVTIHGKALQNERGWRAIQFSALFFILWNLDALAVHFLDNQSGWIDTRVLSIWEIDVSTVSNAPHLALIYYLIRLDHLFCFPGMFFLWRGLSFLLAAHEFDRGECIEISEMAPSPILGASSEMERSSDTRAVKSADLEVQP